MRFDAVNAKIRAMRGELFSQEDYELLCRITSVEGVGTRLYEKKAYTQPLAGLAGAELHRHMLEQKIILSLYYDYERIRLFIFDKPLREYLSALFMQYGFNFLKLLLCMIFDERDIPYTQPELDVLLSYDPKIREANLVAAKTVTDFISRLQGTAIHSMLADTYARQPSLFALERQLDLYYYSQLWRRQAKLPDKESRAVMTRIKGTEIDLLNIMWIYRLKHYYRITDARIYAYLIPISYRLTTASLNKMAECETIAELSEEIAKGPYREVFVDFSHPERAFVRAMRRVYTAETRRHPNTLAAVAGYIFDKEQEINNITTALEGIRYHLPAGEILMYLNI